MLFLKQAHKKQGTITDTARVLTGLLTAVMVAAEVLLGGADVQAASVRSASDINRYDFVYSCCRTVQKAQQNHYKYGNSRTADPTADGRISCDRMVAKALYDLGFEDQPKGGITCGSMRSYLKKHGFIESTGFDKIGYGSIVMVKNGKSYWSHTFVTIDFDRVSHVSKLKVDCGSQGRLNAHQPFVNEPWGYKDTEPLVFNIPETGNRFLDTYIAGADVVTPWISSVTGKKVTANAVSSDAETEDSSGQKANTADTAKSSVQNTETEKKQKTSAQETNTADTAKSSAQKTKTAGAKTSDVQKNKSGSSKKSDTASGKNSKTKKKSKTIRVRSVRLNKKSLTLRRKKTYRLKVTIRPANASNKSVTFTSSNKKVASVSKNGKITAKKKGRAVITVTTKDGKYKAKVKVRVR